MSYEDVGWLRNERQGKREREQFKWRKEGREVMGKWRTQERQFMSERSSEGAEREACPSDSGDPLLFVLP